MSAVATTTDEVQVGGPPADSLHMGVALLIGLTVVQKMVGLVRNVLFCRWLEPYQVGYWELALSFFILASPLVVGGFPGAFGRYAEFFRQRGQLRRFFGRMTFVSVSLALLASSLILLNVRPLAWLIFEDVSLTGLAISAAVCLLAFVGYNYVVILLEAIRQPRWATISRFVHACLFAAISLLWLSAGQARADIVVWSYGLASLCAAVLTAGVILRLFRQAPKDAQPLPERDLWSKMAPAAGCIWTVNLLTNLFTLVDRWMIVHFSGLEPQAAAGLVGQYHSSQALPVLLVGVVLTFNNMFLPYLSCDWETGRKRQARTSLKSALVGVTMITLLAGAVLMLFAPLLFDTLLQGRYNAGLAVLPWALVAAVWTCSHLVAQNYLWCVERPRWVNATILLGLVANIGLNALLLPMWGLLGAAVATAIANMAALAALLWINHMHDMKFDAAMAVVLLSPLAICLGAWPTLFVVAVLFVYEWRWGGLLFERRSQWLQLALAVRSRFTALRAGSV